MYFVYLIECAGGSIYTGIATNLERRFDEHKNKKGGHYTASHDVLKVIYSERFESRSKAQKREAEIKSWRREKKLKLVKRSEAEN